MQCYSAGVPQEPSPACQLLWFCCANRACVGHAILVPGYLYCVTVCRALIPQPLIGLAELLSSDNCLECFVPLSSAARGRLGYLEVWGIHVFAGSSEKFAFMVSSQVEMFDPYWNQIHGEPLGLKQSVLGNPLGCCLCILSCELDDFSRREVSSCQTLTQITLGMWSAWARAPTFLIQWSEAGLSCAWCRCATRQLWGQRCHAGTDPCAAPPWLAVSLFTLAGGWGPGAAQVSPDDFVHCHSLLGPQPLLLQAILLPGYSPLPSLFHHHLSSILGPFPPFTAVCLVSDLIDVFEEQTSLFCKKDTVVFLWVMHFGTVSWWLTRAAAAVLRNMGEFSRAPKQPCNQRWTCPHQLTHF